MAGPMKGGASGGKRTCISSSSSPKSLVASIHSPKALPVSTHPMLQALLESFRTPDSPGRSAPATVPMMAPSLRPWDNLTSRMAWLPNCRFSDSVMLKANSCGVTNMWMVKLPPETRAKGSRMVTWFAAGPTANRSTGMPGPRHSSGQPATRP